ncbi:MAG: hypothetical protein HQK49_18185 [Oligoflexia bacterium]|nr:hypothetical protein [Oligoflexia bacterium]
MRHVKNYLIYPKFQLILIAVQTLMIITCVATFLITVKIAFEQMRTIALSAGLSEAHPFFGLINAQENSIYFPWVIAASIIAIILGSLVSIYISHKLAGPIVKTVGYFQRIAKNGEVPEELKFRKYDFFKELSSAVNLAMDAVKNKSDKKES